MQAVLEWVQQQGIWAPLLFVLVYTGAAVASIIRLMISRVFARMKSWLAK